MSDRPAIHLHLHGLGDGEVVNPPDPSDPRMGDIIALLTGSMDLLRGLADQGNVLAERVTQLTEQGTKIMALQDDLLAEVAAVKAFNERVLTAQDTLQTQLEAAMADDADAAAMKTAMQTAVDELKAERTRAEQELAAATASTPTPPAPAPETPPTPPTPSTASINPATGAPFQPGEIDPATGVPVPAAS